MCFLLPICNFKLGLDMKKGFYTAIVSVGKDYSQLGHGLAIVGEALRAADRGIASMDLKDS